MTAAASDRPYVIDGDAHVLEPPHLWDEYLEPEFRPRAIRIVQGIPGRDDRPTEAGAHSPTMPPSMPEGAEEENVMAFEMRQRLAVDEQLVVDGKVVMTGFLAGLGGVEHDRSQLAGMSYLEGAPRASMESDARVALFDDWQVNGGVVFPTIGILWDSDDAQLAHAYSHAYNRWLYEEFVGANGDRIYPLAHVPLHDPELALAELRRCLKLGFKGMFLAPELVFDKSPAHPDFDPLWHELEDAGLPVCVHVIVRFNRAVPNPGARFALLTERSRTYSFGLGATFQIIPAVASLVMSGLFDRFPRLKLLAVEAGAGWAAYLMDRLDEKYEHFAYGEQTKLQPSEYLRRNVWYVVEPRERTINAMMDLVGESQFIWGSDYPHIDSSIHAPEQIRESVAGLSEHRRKLVLGENARALFQLG